MSLETTSPSSVKITWLIGTLAAFTLFAIIASYSASVARHSTDYYQDEAVDRTATLAKLQHDEQALLAPVDAKGQPTAEWIDQDKKIVRIPIEEAMSKEVETLKAKPVCMGSAMTAVPAPAPPASNPPASTNAAPAAPAAPGAPATAKAPPPSQAAPNK